MAKPAAAGEHTNTAHPVVVDVGVAQAADHEVYELRPQQVQSGWHGASCRQAVGSCCQGCASDRADYIVEHSICSVAREQLAQRLINVEEFPSQITSYPSNCTSLCIPLKV
jgi:hypothetical protein